MLRYYVLERVVASLRADVPKVKETLVPYFADTVGGISSYSVKPLEGPPTRKFYVSRNKGDFEQFTRKEAEHETHRLWECVAFLRFQAANKALRKEGRLLTETLSLNDQRQRRHEELVGGLMLDAHAAGKSMDDVIGIRNAAFAAIENRSRP